jgi:hypothetical protein
MLIWYILPVLVSRTKKNLATLLRWPNLVTSSSKFCAPKNVLYANWVDAFRNTVRTVRKFTVLVAQMILFKNGNHSKCLTNYNKNGADQTVFLIQSKFFIHHYL